jgi:tetratricopeptide (TPR) repeat protein
MLKYLNSFNDVTKTKILFFLVVAITFICFIPTLFNDLLLTWDDGYGIVKNEQIRQLSIETFRWAFTTFYFEDWLPFVWISLAVDYALWGLNPAGYHLTNSIIHALNAGLFFLASLALLKRYISRNAKSSVLGGDRVYYCSLLAALLFAIHPLRVESVAWAFERKDVLSLFFGLLALLAYIRYTSSIEVSGAPSARAFSFLVSPVYWVAITFYCFSLLSKAMLVSLPLVLLVLDWFPLNRINRMNRGRVFLEKALFLLFSGITSAILLAAHPLSKMPFSESDMLSRILIASKSIMGYLLLMVWPINLSHFHLHPGNIQNIGFEYLFPVLLFIAITVCCVLLIKRWPVFMAVWLIYVITLVPVLGFTQVSSTAMADRYTYVPGLAISLLAALAITALAGRFSASHIVNKAVILGTLVVLSAGCYLTVRQISYWKNDVTLWSRAIELQPHFSGRMYFERATAFEGRGEFDKALPDMNEAIAIAEKRRRPNMEELYYKRAHILMQLGETDRATADYNYALSLISGK